MHTPTPARDGPLLGYALYPLTVPPPRQVCTFWIDTHRTSRHTARLEPADADAASSADAGAPSRLPTHRWHVSAWGAIAKIAARAEPGATVMVEGRMLTDDVGQPPTADDESAEGGKVARFEVHAHAVRFHQLPPRRTPAQAGDAFSEADASS